MSYDDKIFDWQLTTFYNIEPKLYVCLSLRNLDVLASVQQTAWPDSAGQQPPAHRPLEACRPSWSPRGDATASTGWALTTTTTTIRPISVMATRSHHFWFFYALLFLSYGPMPDKQTDETKCTVAHLGTAAESWADVRRPDCRWS